MRRAVRRLIICTDYDMISVKFEMAVEDMLTQIAKVIISLVLSGIAALLYALYRGDERKMCMFAMFASTVADVFMTDILGIGAASTYPGAAFFILAHILYAVCFIKAGRRKGYRLINGGFTAGILLTAAAFVLLTGLMLIVTGKVQGMFLPLTAYLVFIGFNLCCQFSYAYSDGGLRRFLMLGMLLFLVSDFLVFMPMLAIVKETPQFNDLIWLAYIPAQLCIVLFCADFRKRG